MTTSKVLEQLQKHGQLLDSDIARATRLPLTDVQASIMELSARGEISKCSVTRFVKGQAVEQLQCRISGYVPRPAPGRKPAAR